jgi:formylglycine-generating enzyme required for sulfatase activity
MKKNLKMTQHYTKIVLLCLVLIQIQCKTAQNSTPKAILPNPPNGVLFSDNLYIDRSEMSVVDWREYEFWTQRTHPNLVNKVLPDTMVWKYTGEEKLTFNSPVLLLKENYYRHPSYNEYPIVGITRQQTNAYCAWRTDRVYEAMLIKRGIIAMNPNQDSSTFFTVERYLSGNYMGYKPDLSVAIPVYRLPTEAEWELAASSTLDNSIYPYGYDFDKKSTAKYIKKRGITELLNTLETKGRKEVGHSNTDTLKMPAPYGMGIKNKAGLYNMIGNVAEMIDEEGVAKGGGYLTPFTDCKIKNRQSYARPVSWVGFRCVCSWERAGSAPLERVRALQVGNGFR